MEENFIMDMQDKFIQMIEDVTELAKINKREVTKEFLSEYFKELELEESQLKLVYDYLTEHNITVAGYDKKPDEAKFNREEFSEKDEAESEYLNIYLDEVKEVNKSESSLKELVKSTLAKDELAKEALVNLFLPKVIEMSKEYRMQGLSQSDLIQEGNIGLLVGISRLSEDNEAEEIENIIMNEVKENMLLALDEVSARTKTNRKIIKKADMVKEKAEELAETMNDKMTMQEMADYMEMDLEEVEDILRITGEEL